MICVTCVGWTDQHTQSSWCIRNLGSSKNAPNILGRESFKYWRIGKSTCETWTVTVECSKISYLRHMLCEDLYSLLQLIMKVKIERRHGTRSKRISWLKNIRDWTDIHGVRKLFRLMRIGKHSLKWSPTFDYLTGHFKEKEEESNSTNHLPPPDNTSSTPNT